jgi:hypothetical protein
MSDNPIARWNANNPHGQKFPKQQIYSQADMDEAKATARAEGYADGVQAAADKITASVAMLRNLGMTEGAEAIEAAASDILTLLPPDNGKGGAE